MEPKGVVGASMPRWISMEDRLPDENVEVLVTSSQATIHSRILPTIAFREGKKFYMDIRFRFPMSDIGMAITHWMPLPSPPVEGGTQSD